jgi:hypothetical protein
VYRLKVFAGLARLTRPVTTWCNECLAYLSAARISDQRGEAVNLLVNKTMGVGHRFGNFESYWLGLLPALQNDLKSPNPDTVYKVGYRVWLPEPNEELSHTIRCGANKNSACCQLKNHASLSKGANLIRRGITERRNSYDELSGRRRQDLNGLGRPR